MTYCMAVQPYSLLKGSCTYSMKNNTLGIDIGSTTVKIAILNENNELLFADYERHYANIQETLASLLSKAYDALGEVEIALLNSRREAVARKREEISCRAQPLLEGVIFFLH